MKYIFVFVLFLSHAHPHTHTHAHGQTLSMLGRNGVAPEESPEATTGEGQHGPIITGSVD